MDCLRILVNNGLLIQFGLTRCTGGPQTTNITSTIYLPTSYSNEIYRRQINFAHNSRGYDVTGITTITCTVSSFNLVAFNSFGSFDDYYISWITIGY